MITSKIIIAATEPPNNKISCEQEEASDPPIAHNAEGKEASEQEVCNPPTQQQEIVRGKEEEVGCPAIAMGPHPRIGTAEVMSSLIPCRCC
jgi:hypothetical protein